MTAVARLLSAVLLLGVLMGNPAVRAQAPADASVAFPSLFRTLAAASVRISRAAHHLIGLEANEEPGAQAVQLQAVRAVEDAVVRLAAEPDGQAVLQAVNHVVFVAGRLPGAVVEAGTLRVTYSSELVEDGHPSADEIAAALRRGALPTPRRS
jgi:hypothetical protein